MPSLYEINLQREILREKSAEILADYIRFFNKNGEDNKIIEKWYNTVGYIHTHIFDPEYNSLEKLKEANGTLDLALEVLKKLS